MFMAVWKNLSSGNTIHVFNRMVTGADLWERFSEKTSKTKTEVKNEGAQVAPFFVATVVNIAYASR